MNLGIAYSGDDQETGDLKQKIEHATLEEVKHIQIRLKDIIDFVVDDKTGYDRLKEFKALVASYPGKISVHLFAPKWDNLTLLGISTNISTATIIDFIKSYLIPMGITLYTIHPYYDKNSFDKLNDDDKAFVLASMATLFAEFATTGATIAIENMPCKDTSLKSCSYGMDLDDLGQIVDLTQRVFIQKGATREQAREQIGITLDTGHATMGEHHLGERQAILKSWIGLYYDAIKCIHFTPAIQECYEPRNDSHYTEINYSQNVYLMKALLEETYRYNLDVPIYTEAHTNLGVLGELHEINKVIADVSKQR